MEIVGVYKFSPSGLIRVAEFKVKSQASTRLTAFIAEETSRLQKLQHQAELLASKNKESGGSFGDRFTEALTKICYKNSLYAVKETNGLRRTTSKGPLMPRWGYTMATQLAGGIEL